MSLKFQTVLKQQLLATCKCVRPLRELILAKRSCRREEAALSPNSESPQFRGLTTRAGALPCRSNMQADAVKKFRREQTAVKTYEPHREYFAFLQPFHP